MKKTPNPRLNHCFSLRKASQCLVILAVLLGFQLTSQAAKILYVQDQGLRDSAKFVEMLRAQGHDLTVLNTGGGDTVSNATDYAAAGYELLIVDEVISSGAVGDRFRNSPIPVINWEGFLYSGNRSAFNADSGLTGGTLATPADAAAADSDYGQVSNFTQITITAPAHPLAAGLSGTFDVFDPSVTWNVPDGNGVISFVGSRTLVSGVTKVAEIPGFANGWAIACVEPGVAQIDGTTNQARWIHLPWNDSQDGRVMVEPSFFLFEAAVAYALDLPQPTKIHNLTPPAVFAATNTTITCAVDKTTAGGSAVDMGGITMTINGVDVTGSLSVTDGGTQWNVSYSGGFEPDSVYHITVSATAADGGTSARTTSLDTLSTDYMVVEAEDFNYSDPWGETNATNGLFFDTKTLCNEVGGGTEGCYFDRVGTEGIDKHRAATAYTVTTPDIAPLISQVYRYGKATATVREETTDTLITGDSAAQARSLYASSSVPDYDVRRLAENDWWNYTRTYPTGTFKIYARMLTSGTNTLQLESVNDGASTNQVTTKLGQFLARGVEGWQTVRLTDDGGAPIVVELTSVAPSTLRLTPVTPSPGLNMVGYFVLVPTTEAVNEPPTAAIDSPVDRSLVYEGQATPITVTVTDDGTISNVQFFANGNLIGEDNSEPYSVDFTPASLGAADTRYTIQVVATDDGGLTGSDSIILDAIDPDLTVVTTEVGNGADAGVNENDDASGGSNGDNMGIRNQTNRNEVAVMRFDLTGIDVSQISDVSFTVVEYRDGSGRRMALFGVPESATPTTGSLTINDWAETNITFETMPGLIFDADSTTRGLNTNQIVLLADNITPTGAKETRLTATDAALGTFIKNNPGSSKMVCFILAVSPSEGDSSGLNQMASKEATALRDGAPVSPTGNAGFWAPFLSFRTSITPPELSYDASSGSSIVFTWTGNYKLQSQTNTLNSAGWMDYPGGTSGVVVPIGTADGMVLFRLAPQ